jgi:hypothetical protein
MTAKHTVAEVRADILSRIPADLRDEHQTLARDVARIDREMKALRKKRDVAQSRISEIMAAASAAAKTDRDLAVLRHSGGDSLTRLWDAIRAIHPRLRMSTNWTPNDAPKNTAPYLGVDVDLRTHSAAFGTYSTETAKADGAALAAALSEFATRFIGDDVPATGDLAGRTFANLMTDSDSRHQGMSLSYTPDGSQATLGVVDWLGEREPINGTLPEVLATAINVALEWAADDNDEDDD